MIVVYQRKVKAQNTEKSRLIYTRFSSASSLLAQCCTCPKAIPAIQASFRKKSNGKRRKKNRSLDSSFVSPYFVRESPCPRYEHFYLFLLLSACAPLWQKELRKLMQLMNCAENDYLPHEPSSCVLFLCQHPLFLLGSFRGI